MAGHPTDYKPDYAREARNYCLMGAIDADLAEFFGVTRRTITNWKKAHPEFRAAIEDGGKQRSNAKVVGRAFDKCMEGDSTMLIFWLKNRLGWRDKTDITANLSGKIETVTRRIIDPKEPEKS